jgi:hypothetical protein
MHTSCHHHTSGQTEAVNKCLEGYLQNFLNAHQSQWHNWLHLAEWWYNTMYRMSTNMSPFEALYVYPPLSIKEYVFSKFKALVVKNYFATFNEILRILKSHPEQSKN